MRAFREFVRFWLPCWTTRTVMMNLLLTGLSKCASKLLVYVKTVMWFFLRWSWWWCSWSSQLYFFKKLFCYWWQLRVPGIKHSCLGTHGFICGSCHAWLWSSRSYKCFFSSYKCTTGKKFFNQKTISICKENSKNYFLLYSYIACVGIICPI